jgi:hypothetical protein
MTSSTAAQRHTVTGLRRSAVQHIPRIDHVKSVRPELVSIEMKRC